jgi:hypothetical protein
MKTKKCTKCLKYKPTSKYYPFKGAKHNLYPSCKDCLREKNGWKKRKPREIFRYGILKRRCIKCQKYKPKTFFYKSKCYRHKISENCKGCCRKEASTELAKTRQKGKRQRVRMEVLIHYGGNPPQCKCCGEKQYEFLSIDHINGGGNRIRRELGNGHLFNKIRRDYPKDLQVLCYNCNMAKGFYGECPHKR